MQENDLVTVNIGKMGLDLAAEKHIKLLLKQHGMIKVKFLKSASFNLGTLEPLVVKRVGRTIILKK